MERAATKLTLDPVARDVAHQYVITNVACLAPWVHYTTLKPLLENCKEVIDAWVSYFLVEQLAKINKLNVGLGYWGCNMHTIQIRQFRAEFEGQ